MPLRNLHTSLDASLSEFLVRHGQFLLPMVELIERSRVAVDEVIEVLGRACIEAVLRLSAQGGGRAQASGKEGQWNQLAWEPGRESDPFGAAVEGEKAEAASGA